MATSEYYDITVWEPIRNSVKQNTRSLIASIKIEIAKDESLPEFQGEYPVPWQLRQIVQQRAESWLNRLYALATEEYLGLGNEVSPAFDRALWLTTFSHSCFREEVIDEYGHKASALFNLLLCAVGCPPVRRNDLKVGQQDCCYVIRNELSGVWHDRLHHLLPRVNGAIATLARQQASELRAARIASGLPAEPPDQKMDEPKSAESRNLNPQNPIAQVETVPAPAEAVAPIRSVEVIVPVPKDPEEEWGNISISFLSDERVQIRSGKKLETLNYAEFGFADGRTENPNRAWNMFRRLAELRGSIKNEKEAGAPWPKVEKRVQEIRNVLRSITFRHNVRPLAIPGIEWI